MGKMMGQRRAIREREKRVMGREGEKESDGEKDGKRKGIMGRKGK